MAKTKKSTQTKKTTKTVKADKKEQQLSTKKTPTKKKTSSGKLKQVKNVESVSALSFSETESNKAEFKKTATDAYYHVSKNAVKFGVLGLVLLLAVGAFFARNYLVVATVNGTPIYRHNVIGNLEKQYGQQAVDRAITETLIAQKAVEQGIIVEESAIDDQMTQIEEQVSGMGQTFDAALDAEGLTREELRNQIRTQKQLEQLAGEPSEITEDDINTYIEQNRDFLPEEATEDELKDIARQQLSSQGDQKHIQEILTNLRAEADITYLFTY